MTTSNCSANGPGLSDRRYFLSALAAAGTLGLGAELPAALAADHPDADLFRLVEQLITTCRRLEAIETAGDQLWDRYVEPEVPEPLFVRHSDQPRVCLTMYRCQSALSDGERRYWYDGPEALTIPARRYWQEGRIPDERFFTAGDRARVDEIKAAHESWQQTIKAAEDVAGLTRSWEASMLAYEQVDALRRSLATTYARTIEGLAAKARAYTVVRLGEVSLLRERLDKLLTDDEADWNEVSAISIVLDAAALGDASQVRA